MLICPSSYNNCHNILSHPYVTFLVWHNFCERRQPSSSVFSSTSNSPSPPFSSLLISSSSPSSTLQSSCFTSLPSSFSNISSFSNNISFLPSSFFNTSSSSFLPPSFLIFPISALTSTSDTNTSSDSPTVSSFYPSLVNTQLSINLLEDFIWPGSSVPLSFTSDNIPRDLYSVPHSKYTVFFCEDCYVGLLCRVDDVQCYNDTYVVHVTVVERIRLPQDLEGGSIPPLLDADSLTIIKDVDLSKDKKEEMEKLHTSLLHQFGEVAKLDRNSATNGYDYSNLILKDLTWMCASKLPLHLFSQTTLLEMDNILERQTLLLDFLSSHLRSLKEKSRLSQVILKKSLDAGKLAYYKEMHAQLQIECGEGENEQSIFVGECKKKLEGKELPASIQKVIDTEMDHLLQDHASQHSTTREYLDWMCSLPWNRSVPEAYNVSQVEEELEKNHHGLANVKQAIAEFVSVGACKGTLKGKFLCLVGPPGTGKTTIARSLAKALGRPLYQFSVGGLNDAIEIRGSRRTYIGALPGQIIQGLKICQVNNPVIIIDELDKMGFVSVHGDPASALLEVLDPDHNHTFRDHYMDVPIDLSNILFICTANIDNTIPEALRDRLEIIRLTGYVDEEKDHIAVSHMIPRALRESGLKNEVHFTSEAVSSLVRNYCREPGVRDLSKALDKICRKIALNKVSQTLCHCSRCLQSTPENEKQVIVSDMFLFDYLGHPLHKPINYGNPPPIGVAVGVNPYGYHFYVECVQSSGTCDINNSSEPFKISGNLSSEMKESCSTVFTYCKSFLKRIQPENEFFEQVLIHAHFPEGGVSKNDPAAGMALATALLSLATNRNMSSFLALTGELTATGRVIGSDNVSERTVGAVRAGIRRLVLPAASKAGFYALEDHLIAHISPHFVDTYDQVYTLAFPND